MAKQNKPKTLTSTSTLKSSDDIKFTFTFTYCLSEKGRELSLLEGGDGKEKQVIIGDVSFTQLNAVERKIRPDGLPEDPFFDFSHSSTNTTYEHKNPAEDRNCWAYEKIHYDAPQDFDTLWYDYVNLFNARRKIINQAIKERELLAENFLKHKDLRADWNFGNDIVYLSDRYKHSYNKKSEVFAEAEKRRQKEREEQKIIDDQKLAERIVKEERRAAAKDQQIKTWVGEFGSENQKERFAANLFPVSEAIQAMKNDAFRALDSFDQFCQIDEEEVRNTCDENCSCFYEADCRVSCRTDDDQKATAEEWELIKKMKSLLPEAAYVLRKHLCSCDDSSCERGLVKRNSVYVKIKAGEFVFNRNFAVE